MTRGNSVTAFDNDGGLDVNQTKWQKTRKRLKDKV